MKADDIILSRFENVFDAEMAKGQLADAGIISVLTKDDGGGMIPLLQWADGVRLIVQFCTTDEPRIILDPEYEQGDIIS